MEHQHYPIVFTRLETFIADLRRPVILRVYLLRDMQATEVVLGLYHQTAITVSLNK